MSEPRINASLLSDQQTIANVPQRVLIIGQKTSVGTATSGQLQESIPNDGSESELFGDNSQVAEMIRAFKRYNKNTQLSAIGLSDNVSGVAAVGDVTFTGTASSDGQYTIYLGSRKNYTFVIDIANGTTATATGALLAAAINANTQVPVTAVNTAGAVELTAVNQGTVANFIGIQVVGTVAGLSVSITKMTGGATNPVLTGIFDVVGNVRYQTIVGPAQYGTTFYTDFLDQRFNVENNILDGVAILSLTDTYANLITAQNAVNSQSLCIADNRLRNDPLYKGSDLFELDYNIAAQFAALRSLRLTEGTDITNYVVAPQANEQVGGVSKASLPYANTPFTWLPVIDIGKGWSLEEEEALNASGGFIFSNNTARSLIVVSRVVTTYKTDTLGQADTTFKYLNLVDTGSAVRSLYFDNYKQRFAQTRLSTGDVQPNSAMVNTDTISAYSVGLYVTFSDQQFLLTVAGDGSLSFYKSNLVVEITNFNLGQVRVQMKILIVTQLRDIVMPIVIAFSTT